MMFSEHRNGGQFIHRDVEKALYLPGVQIDIENAVRSCNRYQLTFDDPRFVASLSEIYRGHREAVELERGFRAEERKRRRRQRASAASVPVKDSLQ